MRLYKQLLLASFLSIAASTSRLQADDAALKARLQVAYAETALDALDLNPWHLVVSVELFDNKGQPTEKGTIEEWWSGAQLHKFIYTSPSYSNSTIENKEGRYVSSPKAYAPALLTMIAEQILSPLPNALKVGQYEPLLEKRDFGKLPADCIHLNKRIASAQGFIDAPSTAYCFERDKTRLLESLPMGSMVIARNRVGTFQGKHVAVDQSITLNNVIAAKAHIESLQAVTPDETVFIPSPDMVKVDRVTAARTMPLSETKVHKVAPKYPEKAKYNHISGTVTLRAIIGIEGDIKFLEVVSAPDADLAASALEAVRQWKYQPATQDGHPVEVDTFVNVNFSFGPSR